MMKHIHYWVADSKGKGTCKCGEERQFTNYLGGRDTFRRYKPPTAEEKKAREMDTVLNGYTWPVS